jgi:hypothetical protein
MIKQLVCGVLLLALTACDGDGFGPSRGDLGSLRYTRAGGSQVPSGTYEVEGEVRRGPTGALVLGEWAHAWNSSDALTVMASRPSGDGTYDIAYVSLPPDVRTGDTFAPVLDCSFGRPLACAELTLELKVTALDILPGIGCRWLAGQVRVTERTGRRIRGTFNATASCADYQGQTGGETIQVTGGSFDVPIMQEMPAF